MTAPLTTGYYEEYLEATRTHWWFRGRERVLEAIVPPLIPLTGEAIIADVGSGDRKSVV